MTLRRLLWRAVNIFLRHRAGVGCLMVCTHCGVKVPNGNRVPGDERNGFKSNILVRTCVFFASNRYFYPSTSRTTSVRADSAILEEIQVRWSLNYATRDTIRVTYAGSPVENAMLCHHAAYDGQDIHVQ